MVARKPDFRAGCRFRLVARFGQRVFQRLALGDVAADALHFDEASARIAHRVIFPRDPAPAVSRVHMLIVFHTRFARFESGKRSEHRAAAVGMQFRRERLADSLRGLHPEQPEEGIVGVGQSAIGRTAEDRVAL